MLHAQLKGVEKVFKSGWWILGEEVKSFEKKKPKKVTKSKGTKTASKTIKPIVSPKPTQTYGGFSFYNELPKTHQEKRPINIAMTTICSKFVDHEVMLFHLEKVIKSGNFISNALCNNGYWRCFDKNWSQSEFFEYGKFVDKSLPEYPQDQIIKLSNKKIP